MPHERTHILRLKPLISLLSVQTIQIFLRRTLFKDRLEAGTMQVLEYAEVDAGGRYVGQVTLPLVGKVKI